MSLSKVRLERIADSLAGFDPREQMVTVLLTQASFTSPEMPDYGRDFRTLAYAALSD